MTLSSDNNYILSGGNKDLVPSYKWVDDRDSPLECMEILSPASASTYRYAVYGGADAIYFGYGEFNARAGGENVTSSLEEVVSFCHLYHVKAFLALNITLKKDELAEVEEIIKETERCNIDAFIICDFALIPLIRKHSRAQIHASTQIGVHNRWGVRFADKFGFDRAVLSREVTLRDMDRIGLQTPIDLEAFIHGALCIGFSGACLLSSMLTGYSGNRGRCNQLCRRFYRGFLDGKERMSGYLLSAKDICMDEYLNKIANCCVRSGKIEGRLRRAEYTAGVTSYYHAVKDPEAEEELTLTDVKKLFNRGDYTAGYFETKDVVSPFAPGHIGVMVGKVEGLMNSHTGLVRSREPLLRQNGYKLMRKDVEVSGCTATGFEKGGYYVINCSEPIKIGDCVHVTTDSELSQMLLSKKVPLVLQISLKIRGGERPYIFIRHDTFCTEFLFETVAEEAQTQPLTEKEIKQQFSKTGDSDFVFDFVSVDTENAFLSKSQLNAMRRKTLDYAKRYLISQYRREESEKGYSFDFAPKTGIEGDFAEVVCANQATEKLLRLVPNIVYAPKTFDEADCQDFYEKMRGRTVWIRPPVFVSESNAELCGKIIDIFDGVVCNNVGLITVAAEKGKKTVAGQNLNITNPSNPLIGLCDGFFLSTELTKNELRAFDGGILYVYGYLPLMYLSYCPRRQLGVSCANCHGEVTLKDERGTYTVRTQKMGKECTHMLKNSILTDIGNGFRERTFYFDFTESNEKEIDKTLENYYESGLYAPIDTNKLHLNRGVK